MTTLPFTLPAEQVARPVGFPLTLGGDPRSGRVYRPQLDWRGDPKSGNATDPENYVGEVQGIIFGSASSQRVGGRSETVSTEGQIGFTGVRVKSGDRIIVNDDVKYIVVGAPQWDYPGIFSDFSTGYMWVEVQSYS